MHNNLFINRLIIVTRSNEIAYDEVFHHGINIIHGDNSSGKSTISHFIFYVLGGYFNDWVKEAKRCRVVVAEVTMNETTFTIRREINLNPETNKGNPNEPIYIYWGPLENSRGLAKSEWQKFSYNSSVEKKSFSNVFFEKLDLPVVKTDSNITMHQILRLLYVDQESPTSSLFLYEQFDTSLIRETVSDLLLGVYSQALYDARIRKIEVDKELDELKRELKVIKRYSTNDLNLFPSHLLTAIGNKEKEIQTIENTLFELIEKNKTVKYTAKTKLAFEKLTEESIIQRGIVANLETQINDLKLDIEDSKYFIENLESKIKAIKNSILTREFLGDFPLDYCPECLSNIIKPENSSLCKLCKSPVDNSFGVTKARKIEQELSFQIKESKSLIVKRERSLLELSSKLESEKINLKQIQSQVNSSLKDVKSIRDEKIDSLYVDKGFAEGEILQLRTLLENAELYQELIDKKSKLESESDYLKEFINQEVDHQEKTKNAINKSIEKEALYLLNNDLDRQQDFTAAKMFNIDYRNNIAFIADKDAKYSASSNFYLKTTARFAIFFASLEMKNMRYPRFILCDNMEDKGIEPKRAHNFQEIIIMEAQKHDKDNYQLIYTTSYLPEKLNKKEYIIGEYYSKLNPSLKNID